MDDILSQTQIDDLLKQILEPTKNSDQTKNIWNCQKCKKQFESIKNPEQQKDFKFGKHAIISNQDGVTKIGIFNHDGEMIYSGAASQGQTYICLKCGYREILIPRHK